MPTYQYRCTECGEPLEVVQSFSDAPLTVCPACGGRLRKVFSPVGVVFKGSGFYKTDSRSTPKANPAETGAAKTDKPAAGGEKASEPAPKAEPSGKGESKGDSKGESTGAAKGDSKVA